MSTDLKLDQPTPITLKKVTVNFDRSSNVAATIATLEAGEFVIIDKFYSDGLTLLNALKSHLDAQLSQDTFKEQREYRAVYQKLSNLILLEIKDHKLTVRKAPEIGWFEKLYTASTDFWLTYPQVQGLNSSWQWYKNGISIPQLRNKIHPYYGVYFPTRFEHLTLFDNWLKRYEGTKKTAIDLGFGSGVLTMLMMKHGFQKVMGTDTNANAIVGFEGFMGTTKLSRKIELDNGDLFGRFDKPTELIVFNPPWLPQAHNLDNVDKAIYYEPELFPSFFEAAAQRLTDDGKIVLLFSNLAQITDVTKAHPIEKEIEEGGRFKLDKFLTKKIKKASDKTVRDQNWRGEEEVELWVLAKHK